MKPKTASCGRAISGCLALLLTVSVSASAQIPRQSQTVEPIASKTQPLVSPDVRKTAWEVLATAAADNKVSRRQNAIVATSTIGTWSKAVGLIESSRSEEHTSELQSPCNIVCRLLLEKK